MDEIEKKDLILTIDGKPVGKVTKSLTMSATFESADFDAHDFIKRMKAAEKERQQLQARFNKMFSAEQQQGIREAMLALAEVVRRVGAFSMAQYATTVDGTKTMIKIEVIKEANLAGWRSLNHEHRTLHDDGTRCPARKPLLR